LRYLEDTSSPVYVFKIKTFTVDFIFSSIFHAVLIYFFLTMPLYKIGLDTSPNPYKVKLIAAPQEKPIGNKIDSAKGKPIFRPKKIEKGIFLEPAIGIENTPSSDMENATTKIETPIAESTPSEASNINGISNKSKPAEPTISNEQTKKDEQTNIEEKVISSKLDIDAKQVEPVPQTVADIKDTKDEPNPKDIGHREGLLIAPLRAVEIEITSGERKDIMVRLTRKGHPLSKASSKEVEVKTSLERSGTKTILWLDEAEPGAYTFSINGKDSAEIEATFILRGKTEGIKTYKTKLEGSGVQYKFLMPEAIFWDDDSYFTGTIEGAESITKFNGSTGLYWTERKR